MGLAIFHMPLALWTFASAAFSADRPEEKVFQYLFAVSCIILVSVIHHVISIFRCCENAGGDFSIHQWFPMDATVFVTQYFSRWVIGACTVFQAHVFLAFQTICGATWESGEGLRKCDFQCSEETKLVENSKMTVYT